MWYFVVRLKGESQNRGNKKRNHVKFFTDIFVFQKIWCVLFSCYLCLRLTFFLYCQLFVHSQLRLSWKNQSVALLCLSSVEKTNLIMVKEKPFNCFNRFVGRSWTELNFFRRFDVFLKLPLVSPLLKHFTAKKVYPLDQSQLSHVWLRFHRTIF